MRSVATVIGMRAARSMAVAFVLAGTLGSCIDEATQLQREGVSAETDAIRLYLDNQPVMTVYQDGQITLGPIVFLRTATNVTTDRPFRVELLDRAGNVIPNLTGNEVRINVGTNSTATASFIRQGPFSGLLRSTTTTLPATTDLIVGLYDMEQRRVSIGPYSVRITARLP
jgi:hypothetical protein